MVLDGTPPGLPNDVAAHLFNNKENEAAARGAAGFILVGRQGPLDDFNRVAVDWVDANGNAGTSPRSLRIRMRVRTYAEGASLVDIRATPPRFTIRPGEQQRVELAAKVGRAPIGEASAEGSVTFVPSGGAGVNVPLGDVTFPDGSRADRWSVAVVPVNDWGEIGPANAGGNAPPDQIHAQIHAQLHA